MIVSVKELHQRRRSSKSGGKQKHVREWMVITDDIRDGTATAINAPGIPVEGSELDGDPFTRCVDVDCQPQQESGKHFLVVADYESAELGIQPFDVHPLDRPPEYVFGGDAQTESWFRDETVDPEHPDDPTKNHLPCVNVLGDKYDPLPERERGVRTITITRNELFWSSLVTEPFENTTNADQVTVDGVTYDFDLCKMGIVTASKINELWQGIPVEYYKVTYPIKADKRGWADVRENYSIEAYFNVDRRNSSGETVTDKERRKIFDPATNLPITEPWPLDENGFIMPNRTDDPYETVRLPYASVAWAPIDLK